MWPARPPDSWPDNVATAAVLPAGRLEVFERSGHYPFVEEPERFTPVAAFRSFVAG